MNENTKQAAADLEQMIAEDDSARTAGFLHYLNRGGELPDLFEEPDEFLIAAVEYDTNIYKPVRQEVLNEFITFIVETALENVKEEDQELGDLTFDQLDEAAPMIGVGILACYAEVIADGQL